MSDIDRRGFILGCAAAATAAAGVVGIPLPEESPARKTWIEVEGVRHVIPPGLFNEVDDFQGIPGACFLMNWPIDGVLRFCWPMVYEGMERPTRENVKAFDARTRPVTDAEMEFLVRVRAIAPKECRHGKS